MQAWQDLLLPHATAATERVGRALLDCWSEPHRRYHDLDHLRAVLDAIDELAGLATDLTAVKLAAWYHDSVYHGLPDDEENSARKAEAELTALGLDPALVAEVARLIRMTVEHDPVPGDHNAEVLSDADLAALAVAPEQYRRNSAAIRAEYLHVPDGPFQGGRATVIVALLSMPALYRTETGQARWEDAARRNLQAELEMLTSRTSP